MGIQGELFKQKYEIKYLYINNCSKQASKTNTQKKNILRYDNSFQQKWKY